jgi:hypothetical protein
MPRVVLGPARPPRMPMNLVERCNEQQGGWEKGKIWDIKYILMIG